MWIFNWITGRNIWFTWILVRSSHKPCQPRDSENAKLEEKEFHEKLILDWGENGDTDNSQHEKIYIGQFTPPNNNGCDSLKVLPLDVSQTFTFFPLSQSLNCWVLIAATKNGSEHANVKLEEMSRNSAIWRLGKWFEISQRDKLIAHELEWNQSNPIHLTHFAIRSADCSTVSSSTQVSPRLKPTMWITSITMWVLVRHLLVPPLLWQVTKTDMMIFGFWCLIY